MTMESEPPVFRPMNAHEALESLREGNDRFARNLRSVDSMSAQVHSAVHAYGQAPKAIVLSCSDSRVPAELVFECGLGELFVVRVAGNVCAPSIVGSVEFAAAKFGTELVVVMGHTNCGAIKAAVDALRPKAKPSLSDNIHDIVDRITPAIADIVDRNISKEQMLADATRANVRQTSYHLRYGSRLLEERIRDGKFVVVGSVYSLETGRVDFFDVPQTGSLSVVPLAPPA